MLLRAFPLLLASLSLFVIGPVAAQNPLSQVMNFDCPACTPSDALVQLSRQSGVNIVFNDRFFARCNARDFHFEQQQLGQILDEIGACAAVTYRLTDQQVVFSRKRQKFTLSGYVADEVTGERLIGASVRVLVENGAVAVTNDFGFFSLHLDEGEYRLLVSYIGYRPIETGVSLQSGKMLKIYLSPGESLPEVVISALPTSVNHVKSQEARQSLPLADLPSMPMPAGEADLIRLAALQPGVQTGVDGLGGLHVRGGNADQNLILLDDVPVYNPGHALGLLSIFNPRTISSTRLWKGDFPARYGSRASSVLDVRTRDGNFHRHEATASIGLLASSATVEGPIGKKEKCSFLASGRGTYMGPWVNYLNKRENLLTFSGDDVAYRFYDASLKLNYIFSPRNRLYFSLYRGGDNFRDAFLQTYFYPESIVTDRYSFSSKWGNAIAALRWNQVLNNKLFSNTTLRFSRFYYQSNLSFNSSAQFPSGKQSVLQDYGRIYQTIIRDWSIKSDFTWYSNERVTLRWGGAYTFHNFRPGALNVNFLLTGMPGNNIDSLAQILRNEERLAADESELYADLEWRFGHDWKVDAGLNGTIFQIRTTGYAALLPRLRVEYATPDGWSFWAGYHRMSQNLHQIGSFNVSLPFELWVPSTAKVRPELVGQLSAGFGWQKGVWHWQIEGYHKKLDRVLTFLAGNDALAEVGAEDASGWEDRISEGTGLAHGVEFLFEKNRGNTTWSAAYTLSESTRQFPDLNSGRAFPYRFDRRHDLKISLRQRITRWLSGEVLWVYASGNPITLSAVKFQHLSPEGEVSREVFAYTEVNGYRLPAYHRLDVAFNTRWTKKRFEHGLQLGVYNAYNRANPFFIYVDAGSGVKGRAIQYTLLPVLPVFRYELKF